MLRRHHLLAIAIAITIAIITLPPPRAGHAVTAGIASAAQTPTTPGACPVSLNFRVKRLQDDTPQDFCQYVGRVVLVVNTASYYDCTYQYEGFEALYAKYRDEGPTVLGFPSNDFQQGPDSSKQIADFCYNTRGVKFPMFSKTVVMGADTSPLCARLVAQTDQLPKWNFHRYLLDRVDHVTTMFPSSVELGDPALIKRTDTLLAEPSTRSSR